MTENQPEVPAVGERSGDEVVEGVETAAEGTRHEGVQRPPESATPGTSPVEQAQDDRTMTEGADVAEVDVPETRVPEAPVSGGAQTIAGGRISDRASAAGSDPETRRR